MKSGEERLHQLVERKEGAIKKVWAAMPDDLSKYQVRRLADAIAFDENMWREFDRYIRTVQTMEREMREGRF